MFDTKVAICAKNVAILWRFLKAGVAISHSNDLDTLISATKILMAESDKHTITPDLEVKMRQILKSNFNEKCAKMELC